FIIFVYLALLFRCIRLYKRCPYAFGAFLALGLSFTLVLQAMANMAVNVNLFPVTGVTLPLVSMGGSSFLFTCLAIGIILSVARNVEQHEGKERLKEERARAREEAEADAEAGVIEEEEGITV
ncbi:MAG: cell division protein FtsW, partial [Chitinophagaceae bacterium]